MKSRRRLLLIWGLFVLGCPGPDYEGPEVSIVAPAAGATVDSGTAVRAVATDRSGVVAVSFYAGALLLGTDSTAEGDTFEVEFSLAGFEPGEAETLTCAARDGADNVGYSSPVAVTIGLSAGRHHAGIIAGPETWSAADNPHVVDGELFVDAVLRLAAGVKVLVASGVGIRVGQNGPGGLLAPDGGVTFTALSRTPEPGAWKGIEFKSGAVAESCRLQGCVVEYGGGNGRALMVAETCAVSIEGCILRQSSTGAVAAYGCGFGRFSGNTMSGCAGLPVRVEAAYLSSVGTDNSYSGNERNGIEVAGGTVRTSDTWPNPGVPLFFTAPTAIADSSNPLVTITPGCSLCFAESAGLRIGDPLRSGGLRADGTFGSIVLAGIDGRAWPGIEFWEKADSVRSSLRFCRVVNASGTGIMSYVPLALSGCRVEGCGGSGVVLRNCGFAGFTNNTVTGCGRYPLELGAVAVATIGTGNVLSGNGSDAVRVTGGAITANAHQWRNLGVAYAVAGTVEVGSDYEPQLIIDSGTRLRFDPGSGIIVGRDGPAVLRCRGVPDSITFTALPETAGSWNGVELGAHADNSSVLERCRLLYGGGAGRGILYVDSCMPTITGNEIAWSSNYCIFLNNTELDPAALRLYNWLHDWGEGYEDIYEGKERLTSDAGR